LTAYFRTRADKIRGENPRNERRNRERLKDKHNSKGHKPVKDPKKR